MIRSNQQAHIKCDQARDDKCLASQGEPYAQRAHLERVMVLFVDERSVEQVRTKENLHSSGAQGLP